MKPLLRLLSLLLVLAPPLGRAADALRVRDRFVDDGGVRIHYVTRGRGPLVVLIHGFPDFWYGWRAQIAALSPHYQVAALDLRGYNLSDKPAGVDAYAMPNLVADVAAVIHDLGRERATIVGHDWGGAIAWTFAILHPELTERLVVLQTPHPRGMLRELRTDPAQQAASAYARNFQDNPGTLGLTAAGLAVVASGGNDDARARYLDAFTRSDVEAMLNYYRANYPRAPYDDVALPNVQAPVLILDGVADPFLLPAGHDGTWQWVDASVTLVTVPGVGHFIQQQAPALVSRAIDRWLRDRRADERRPLPSPALGSASR
jgi:pimeloyl-ACP methyl ester carboxylesterase